MNESYISKYYHLHTWTHTNICTRIYIHKNIIFTHIAFSLPSLSLSLSLSHTHTHTHTHIYIYVCVCVCVCVCKTDFLYAYFLIFFGIRVNKTLGRFRSVFIKEYLIFKKRFDKYFSA